MSYVCSPLSRIFSCKGYFVCLYFEHLGQKICSVCIHRVGREPQLWHVSALPNSTELLQFIQLKNCSLQQHIRTTASFPLDSDRRLRVATFDVLWRGMYSYILSCYRQGVSGVFKTPYDRKMKFWRAHRILSNVREKQSGGKDWFEESKFLSFCHCFSTLWW